MKSSFNKKILIVVLGSLGLLVVDYLLKKCCIMAGLNTNHSTIYHVLNWGSFLIIMAVGKWLVNTQLGRGKSGYFIIYFLLVMSAYLINSTILFP